MEEMVASRCPSVNGYEVFPSSEGNVWKYVFDFGDAIAETVLYRYVSFAERTVVCCSVQSGCPVGCAFCGTGKRFVRNLSTEEIVKQVDTVLTDAFASIESTSAACGKLQIMFMSMGEPMLNWDNVLRAIYALHDMYPNAQLLLSTVGIFDVDVLYQICAVSMIIDSVGLQFSIHRSTDDARNKLIPYENKLSLNQIAEYGGMWANRTGRHPYLNYCIDGTNNSIGDADRLMSLFNPSVFNMTFSVVCSSDETMRDAGFRNIDAIRSFEQRFAKSGYNTRVFDPAGQDDIGGGCGQLWYVQKWIKDHEESL